MSVLNNDEELLALALQFGNNMVSCFTHPKGPTTAVEFKVSDGSLRRFADALLAASPVAAPAPQCVPAELLRIGELLRTQDNRYTDQPMFIVQQKRLLIGLDPDYSSGPEDIVWWIDDCQYFAGSPEFEELEREYDETGGVPDDWHRHSFVESWEFVTACFTEQGCKDYLAINGHNLKETRIYADGSYRNNEFRALRNWLMSLPSPAMEAQSHE